MLLSQAVLDFTSMLSNTIGNMELYLNQERYSAAMDFLISLIFLLLGIFPLAIQRHHELASIESQYLKYPRLAISVTDKPLNPSQQYAFSMGWVLWYVFIPIKS
jgi:hypothetical protein